MNIPAIPAEKPAITPAQPAGLGSTLRTVIFGLLGVAANRQELADGNAKISPLRIIVVAVVFMAIFVGSLVTLASKIAAG